jgi:alpha-amylase/alpha-mannosidase (GH57 family)
LEPGASPYRNWNERIHQQCYKPNAELGNFEHISFDLGPTLVEWMAAYDRKTLANIIEQDHRNFQHYGVGNAMAQSYSHTILPLSNRQDKITQIRWGIMDFEHTFSHHPAGMWLPETAVDMECLEIMAEHGIEYTILAPWQADVEKIDVSLPYIVRLSQNKSIAVFFYDRALSDDVSFRPEVTTNADDFVLARLLPRFRLSRKMNSEPEFHLIASDGEAYGHHQPFRDKFLARLVNGAIEKQPIDASYPGIWLKEQPPVQEIRIRNNTSWSCHHGVVRWSGVCDCTPHAEWKAPLRKALNTLANAVDEEFLTVIHPLIPDPWELRHDYIRVMSGQISINDYIQEKIPDHLTSKKIDQIAILLEAQYERQRMFTSCGWFFDDFDRIEPRNNIAYAAQAAWLVKKATGTDISAEIIKLLKEVKSWRSGLSADVVFQHHIEKVQNSRA